MTSIIGHVAALNRYPVKSMAGEPLDVAELDWQGIEGDRQYGFLFDGSLSRFPWCTARDVSDLVLHRARFLDSTDPRRSVVEVTAPDGWCGRIDAPELLARLSAAAGAPLRLVQLGNGAFDSMPVSVVTTAAHRAVEIEHGGELDPRRFRANIVIESDRSQGEWAGKRLIFGDAGAELLITDGIPRCAMVTVDPDTAERSPGILRTIAQEFGNTYGAYAAPARKGYVNVGDVVRVLA